MRCEDVSEALPEIVDGAATADLALRRHVDSCLRCQAELAQYRKLLRTMHPPPACWPTSWPRSKRWGSGGR
jgi:hypothetical protein